MVDISGFGLGTLGGLTLRTTRSTGSGVALMGVLRARRENVLRQ
jgi:hypothetical protein